MGSTLNQNKSFGGGGVQCSRIKLRTSPWNKYLVVLAWLSRELQADYVVCPGQEVPLIFLRPAVCLELISISCVYAVSAGTSRRPRTSASAQVELGLFVWTPPKQLDRRDLRAAPDRIQLMLKERKNTPFLSVFCIINLANVTAERAVSSSRGCECVITHSSSSAL